MFVLFRCTLRFASSLVSPQPPFFAPPFLVESFSSSNVVLFRPIPLAVFLAWCSGRTFCRFGWLYRFLPNFLRLPSPLLACEYFPSSFLLLSQLNFCRPACSASVTNMLILLWRAIELLSVYFWLKIKQWCIFLRRGNPKLDITEYWRLVRSRKQRISSVLTP